MCHLSSLSTQTQAVADQFTQLSPCPSWNGTASYQAVAEQIGDPFGVFDISLPTWHSLDVPRVGHQQVQPGVFQNVVDGLPKYACRFHGDVADIQRLQPLAEREQISR